MKLLTEKQFLEQLRQPIRALQNALYESGDVSDFWDQECANLQETLEKFTKTLNG